MRRLRSCVHVIGGKEMTKVVDWDDPEQMKGVEGQSTPTVDAPANWASSAAQVFDPDEDDYAAGAVLNPLGADDDSPNVSPVAASTSSTVNGINRSHIDTLGVAEEAVADLPAAEQPTAGAGVLDGGAKPVAGLRTKVCPVVALLLTLLIIVFIVRMYYILYTNITGINSKAPAVRTSVAGPSCGVHGQPSADGSTCVCAAGYYSPRIRRIEYLSDEYLSDSLRAVCTGPYPQQYVISGSVGRDCADKGPPCNLDGVYSLVEAHCSGRWCDGQGYSDGNPTTCDGVPMYQEGGAEGNVLYRFRGAWFVDGSVRLADCHPDGWWPTEYGGTAVPYVPYARRDINPGQQPGAPDNGTAYGAWQQVRHAAWEQVSDTSLIVQTLDEVTTICARHGTWNGSACVCGPSWYGWFCNQGPYPTQYVISGSVGTSDGGNLDGVYSLVEAHCNGGHMCGRRGSPASSHMCGGRPVYQKGGAEGNVLFGDWAWSTLYVFDSTALADCGSYVRHGGRWLNGSYEGGSWLNMHGNSPVTYAYAVGHRRDVNLEERQRPSKYATYAWKESSASVPAQYWTDTPARHCGGIECSIPGRRATAASGRDSPLAIASTRDEAAATCTQHGSWNGSACSSCRDNFAGGFCTDSCGEHGTSDGSVCACDVGFGGRLCHHDLCGRRDQEPSGCCYADGAILYRNGQGHTSFCCHGGLFDRTQPYWRCM
eukprot:SAG31_NODE_151_length_22216_cov_37.572139_13_plen_709_part_00